MSRMLMLMLVLILLHLQLRVEMLILARRSETRRIRCCRGGKKKRINPWSMMGI